MSHFPLNQAHLGRICTAVRIDGIVGLMRFVAVFITIESRRVAGY